MSKKNWWKSTFSLYQLITRWESISFDDRHFSIATIINLSETTQLPLLLTSYVLHVSGTSEDYVHCVLRTISGNNGILNFGQTCCFCIWYGVWEVLDNLLFFSFLEVHVVSCKQQRRQWGEPSDKTLRFSLAADFWRDCMLCGSPPCFDTALERRNENIKYLITSRRNWTHNLVYHLCLFAIIGHYVNKIHCLLGRGTKRCALSYQMKRENRSFPRIKIELTTITTDTTASPSYTN